MPRGFIPDIEKYKKYYPSDPDFFKPRGSTFTLESITASTDYNFGGTDTGAYPETAVNIFPGGASAPAGDGLFIVPPANKVVYIDDIKIFFNHSSRSLFLEPYKDRVSTDASTINFVQSGTTYIKCVNAYRLTTTSKEDPLELPDALSNSQYFYSMDLPIHCPRRLDGDAGEYFGIKTSGGKGIYLGGSFAANSLTLMHFQFSGWVVDKVQIADNSYQEVIPIH